MRDGPHVGKIRSRDPPLVSLTSFFAQFLFSDVHSENLCHLPIIITEILGRYTPTGGTPKYIPKVFNYYSEIVGKGCLKHCVTTEISAGAGSSNKLNIPAERTNYEVANIYKYVLEVVMKEALKGVDKFLNDNKQTTLNSLWTTSLSHILRLCAELRYWSTFFIPSRILSGRNTQIQCCESGQKATFRAYAGQDFPQGSSRHKKEHNKKLVLGSCWHRNSVKWTIHETGSTLQIREHASNEGTKAYFGQQLFLKVYHWDWDFPRRYHPNPIFLLLGNNC